MSAKQTALEVIEQLPNGVTLSEIVAALQEAEATEEALRRFDERGGIPDEDLTEEEWRQYIAYTLKEELEDPRQDIYTLEDGEPYDGQG